MGSLKKLGFMALAPFKVKDKKELNRPEGFAKETANATLGYFAGALSGVIPAGLYLAAHRKRLIKPYTQTAGLALGGAMVGGTVGGVRSLRKTERKAGVQPSGAGKFMVRGGSAVGGYLAGERAGRGLGIPASLATGYIGTRNITKYKKPKKKKKGSKRGKKRA